MLGESELADVLWALANARHFTTRLCDFEAAVVDSGGLAVMSPAESSRVLWAFASLNYRPERLLSGLSPQWTWKLRGRKGGPESVKEGSINDFSTSQLTSSLWSLAVLEQVNSAPFIQAWSQLMGSGGKQPVRSISEIIFQGEIVLAQIWQAAIAVSLESSWSVRGLHNPKQGSSYSHDLGIDLSGYHPSAQKLLSEARTSFLKQTNALRKKVHGGYQRSIANSLPSMSQGGGHLVHLLEDTSAGGYAIDISLPALRIAIEADGPTHLARNDVTRMLGGTMMKHRHLRSMGWSVVSITFVRWDECDTAEKRKRLLEQAITSIIDDKIDEELSIE